MATIEPITVDKFERFFRAAAGLDVDKSDVRSYNSFVNQKARDLLIRARAAARANGREVIEPFDLPITKGLQECIHEFKKTAVEIDLNVIEYIAALPQLNIDYSDATKAELPKIAGGISVALARAFKIIDPELKNPQTLHWERAFGIFNLLL